MQKSLKASIPLILPFATWMALMFALPSTAAAYAARSAATLAVGLVCLAMRRRFVLPSHNCGDGVRTSLFLSVPTGIAAGAAICALWIVLPAWPFPEPVAPSPSPYAPEVCGWPLTIAKLVGSAFIIAPAEELFFRSFLYRRLISRDITSVPLSQFDLSAFLWTVLLFTLEHDRPLAAALTGAVYGILAIRLGIGSAISAHVTTNLLLAIHVIYRNAWQFW